MAGMYFNACVVAMVCTMDIIHCYTSARVHACVHACAKTMAHACTMAMVHACTKAIMHSYTVPEHMHVLRPWYVRVLWP